MLRLYFYVIITLAQFYCFSEIYHSPTDLLAFQIITNLPQQDEKYLNAIIEGIEASSNNVNVSDDENQAFLSSDEYERRWNAHQHLIASEKWMQKKMNEESISILIPSELLYHVVKEGNGQSLTSEAARVRISHLVMKFNDLFPESSDKDKIYELSHLIPGLVKGMHAMRVGEIRKIYIHPKHAYGDSNYFEPNCALEVTVELLNILSSDSDAISDTAPLDAVQTIQPPFLTRKTLEDVLIKKYYVLGWRLWSHLKFGYFLFNREELLLSLRKKNISLEHSSEIDREINRIHWLIYQKRIQDSQVP